MADCADEVRALGRLLNIPAHLVGRHPFPGPGLAIRILGEVTRDQIAILQHADDIYIEEVRAAGLYDQISQAFVALLPVKAVGVAGDARTYDQVVALRAVSTEDFMTADWYVIPPFRVLFLGGARGREPAWRARPLRQKGAELTMTGSSSLPRSSSGSRPGSPTRSRASTGSCTTSRPSLQERECSHSLFCALHAFYRCSLIEFEMRSIS